MPAARSRGKMGERIVLNVEIITDEEILGAGVRSVLGEEARLRIVEPDRPIDVVPLFRTARPEVLILCFRDEDTTVGVLQHAKRLAAPPAVVVLRHQATADGARRLLLHGADGILHYASAAGHLAWAVVATAGGSLALCPDLSADVVAAYLRPARLRESAIAARERISRLSPREREVVACAADGMSNSQIADALCVSPYTVKDHLRRICDKLGTGSRLDVARLAWQAGLPGDRESSKVSA